MRAPLKAALGVLLLSGFALFGYTSQAAAQTAPAPTPIICALVLNGRPVGDFTIVAADGDHWIAEDDLRGLGLRIDPGTSRRLLDQPHIALKSLAPEVVGRFDERDVRLELSAAAPAFSAHTNISTNVASAVRARPFSAFLNYGATVREPGRSTLSAELGMTLLGRFFVRSTAAGRMSGKLQRGDTSVTLDDEQRMVRWIAGDGYSRSGWSGGLQPFAGLSVARQFSMDPAFLATGPLAMSGSTAVPATAEIYVNGNLVRRVLVEPGSFEFRDIAPTAGAGEVRVLLRDELGRMQETSAHYYRSPHVLRQGLHEFQYNAGVQRDRYDGGSHYGGFVGSAFHRVGLTRHITFGLSGDLTADLASGGGSMAASTSIGSFEISAFGSRKTGTTAQAAAFAYGYRSSAFDFYSRAHWSSAGFAEIGRTSIDRETLSGEAGVGLTLPRGLRLAAAYASSDDLYGRRAFVNLSAQIGLGPTHLWVTTVRSIDGRSWTGTATVSLALGARRSAAASVTTSATGSADVASAIRQSLPWGPGIGYELQWQGAAELASGQVDLQHSRGRVFVRHDDSPLGVESSMNIAGAVAVVGRAWRLTRPIDDAFALIKVGHVPGVRAYVSNQYVGRTNSRGELLVPGLASFYPNRVSINDRDVPITYEVGETESQVSPGLRGGNVVAFDVREVRLLSGRFVLPVSSSLTRVVAEVRWPSGGERVVLAEDGSFVFERAAPGRYVAQIRGENFTSTCTVHVRAETDRASSEMREQRVGDVACVPSVLFSMRVR